MISQSSPVDSRRVGSDFVDQIYSDTRCLAIYENTKMKFRQKIIFMTFFSEIIWFECTHGSGGRLKRGSDFAKYSLRVWRKSEVNFVFHTQTHKKLWIVLTIKFNIYLTISNSFKISFSVYRFSSLLDKFKCLSNWISLVSPVYSLLLAIVKIFSVLKKRLNNSSLVRSRYEVLCKLYVQI